MGRARKLLALALHPTANETEARNAAMAFCRLVSARGLLSGATPAIDDIADLLQRARREAIRQVREEIRRTETPPAQTTNRTRNGVRIQPDPNANEILIGWPANCDACLKPFVIPSTAMWSRGQYFHVECYIRATERKD
jgi:hypothetical protein